MKTKTSYFIIAHAVIWAAMILAVSLLLSGTEIQAHLLILIAGWFGSQELLKRSLNIKSSCKNNLV